MVSTHISQIGFIQLGATITYVGKPPPRYGFFHSILYHQAVSGITYLPPPTFSNENLRGHQHTPGTYPRPPKQQFMFRNSFLLRVWGCLGYVWGVCWSFLSKYVEIIWNLVSIGSTPQPRMPVTTRIVTSLVRNPELNPSLPVTGWGGRSMPFKLKVNCPEFFQWKHRTCKSGTRNQVAHDCWKMRFYVSVWTTCRLRGTCWNLETLYPQNQTPATRSLMFVGLV